jgi:putative addiction module component (TIGR02574 family)
MSQPLITDNQRQELERRVVEDDANPEDVVEWEQVKAQTLARLLEMSNDSNS